MPAQQEMRIDQPIKRRSDLAARGVDHASVHRRVILVFGPIPEANEDAHAVRFERKNGVRPSEEKDLIGAGFPDSVEPAERLPSIAQRFADRCIEITIKIADNESRRILHSLRTLRYSDGTP